MFLSTSTNMCMFFVFLFFVFLPQASFSLFYFWELFLSLQKRGNIPNYIRLLEWAIELRMGESISLQNRRTKRVCIRGWSVCVCVYVCGCVCVDDCLCICVDGGLPCMRLLTIESGCISVWGKLWQPGVFVLKFRQGSRWLFSVWLSKLASCGVRVHRLWWCRSYCCIGGDERAIDRACQPHPAARLFSLRKRTVCD